MFRLSLQSELDMSGTESEKVILSCLDNTFELWNYFVYLQHRDLNLITLKRLSWKL